MGATTDIKKFADIYNDLNDSKKALIRSAFIEYHGFTFDTFYKKLRNESAFRPNEQVWILEYLEKYLEMDPSQITFPTHN